MALIVERQHGPVTTDSIKGKGRLCNTCKTRKHGLFTQGTDGHPLCADCARALGRPID